MELEILGKSKKSELTFFDKELKYSEMKYHLFSNSARYLLGMSFISLKRNKWFVVLFESSPYFVVETSFLYNYQRTLKVALQPSWSSFRVIYTVAILYHESDYSAAFQAEIIVYLDHLQLLFPAPSCGQLQGTLWKPEWTPADSPTYICLEWKNGIH